MHLATWNLECALPSETTRLRRLRASMAEVRADVWVLTEAHPDVAPGSEFERVACSATAPDRVAGGRWVVLWIRCGLTAHALTAPGDPERAAAMFIARAQGRPLLVAGSVLPWRSDGRHPVLRGGPAFVHALCSQAAGWAEMRRSHPEAELAVLGDLNQELDAPGPVGTRVGRDALTEVLAASGLRCVTGEADDPLQARGWRANIDHVLLSAGLQLVGAPHAWPDSCPPPRDLSDHHGISVVVGDV
jgi:endonuclease/exonuclease/phosphatase family metal-dependent hydrolase